MTQENPSVIQPADAAEFDYPAQQAQIDAQAYAPYYDYYQYGYPNRDHHYHHAHVHHGYFDGFHPGWYSPWQHHGHYDPWYYHHLGRITTNINIILALIRFIINHVQKDSPNAVCIRAVIYVFPPLSTMQSAR